MNDAELARAIANSFSAEGLDGLCFDLHIDYDDLPGTTKSGKARSLVRKCLANGSVDELIVLLRRKRPILNWQWSGFDIGNGQKALNLQELFDAATRDRLFGQHHDALQKYQQIKSINPYYPGLEREIAAAKQELTIVPHRPPAWLSGAVLILVVLFIGLIAFTIQDFVTSATVTPQIIIDSTPNATETFVAAMGTQGTMTPTSTTATVTSTPTASSTATPTVSITPTATPTTEPIVLWDLSHYQDTERSAEDDIALYRHDNYSSVKVNLANRSLKNNISTTSLEDLNLASYRLIIINLGWSWEEPYTAVEAELIEAYVSEGGNLILIGDHENTPNENINILASRFGIIFGASPFVGTNFDGLEFLTDLSDHSMFEGVDTLIIDYWDGAISVENDVNLIAAARHSNGQLVVAALEVGRGKVLALGSMGMWTDSEIASFQNEEQNLLFAKNVFDWMLNGTRSD